MIEIPLDNGAENADTSQDIQLGDVFMTMRIRYQANWPSMRGTWAVDLYVEGELKVAGMMLEAGAEISKSFPETYKNASNLGRFFFVGNDPTLENLGVENHLVWLPND